MTNNKVALILHGWPQPVTSSHILFKALQERGYKILCPYLFDMKERLNKENVMRAVKQSLGEEKPDLIVGMSMGGLIIPWLALDYPKALLVFVATGVRLAPESGLFKFITKVASSPIGNLLIKLFLLAPESLLELGYKIVNPYKGTGEFDKKIYLSDLEENIKCIKNIPSNKHLEALNLIKNVNNSELLSKLNSEAIIICGDSDKLMTENGSLELKSLIKRSELIVVHAEHFNVLNENTISELMTMVSLKVR